MNQATSTPVDWETASLPSLVRHLVDVHHHYTRLALGQISRLSTEACVAEGGHRPLLLEVTAACRALEGDLLPHMMKEERILFPYMIALHAWKTRGAPMPVTPFVSIAHPIHVMNMEHDDCTRILREVRARTDDYAIPPDAGSAWRALYAAMVELEEDLREHMHLETEVLFPRAIAAAPATGRV